MEDLIKLLYDRFDKDFVKHHTEALAAIERRQTFPAYNEAALYTYNLLKEQGMDAEIIRFPADGRAVYQDKRTPIAWDASLGRLTVLSPDALFKNPVIADYEKEPFALVKHSVATPPGGVVTRLITQAQALAGEDARGAMVLCDTDTHPGFDVLKTMLDMGAIGLVSDFLTGWELTLDSTGWINAGTENGNWHCQADERDFINFSVTPRIGRKLRAALNGGEVAVRVESDGRRYAGHIDAVTALIPGKRKQEVWVVAHLYEPMQDDNSAGVVCGIWIAMELKRMVEEGLLPAPEFSLRIAFAAEMYGFAALADHFGGSLRKRAVTGINIDGLSAGRFPAEISIRISAFSSVPNFGNMVMRDCVRAYHNLFDAPLVTEYASGFGDDMFMCDRSVGLPLVFPLHKREIGVHHNSIQTENYLEMEPFAREGAMCAAFILKILTMDAGYIRGVLPFAAATAQELIDKEACVASRKSADNYGRLSYFARAFGDEITDFKRVADIPEIDETANTLKIPDIAPETGKPETSAWLKYAENVVPGRASVGFPFDLINLPPEERGPLPYNMIYGPYANIISLMDGKRNMADIIRETEWETHKIFSGNEIKKLISTTFKLARGNYLTVDVSEPLTKKAIAAALRDLGVTDGDVLLVHSSVSGLGYVEGGAEAVIDGLLEAVNGGTVCVPVFTRPYFGFDGAVNKHFQNRPFYPGETASVWTGAVPKTLAARPDALRSGNATHSWAAVGKDAKYLTSGHKMLEPPASANSAMAKALSKNGKVVFIGCDISANTFLHFLEERSGAECLSTAIIKIQEPDGRLRTETIPRHLPGHRDFYRRDALNGKFYQRAIANGLEIRTAALGAGKATVMELRQLYEIGMRLIKEDPRVLLCDDPDCQFCSKF